MDFSFFGLLPAAPPPVGVVPDFEHAAEYGQHHRLEQILQACIALCSIVLVFRLVARCYVLRQFGFIDCESHRAFDAREFL